MESEDVHLFALIMTVCAILYADHEGISYLRGKKATLNPTTVMWLHRFVSTGLFVMIATGVMMALPGISYYLREPVFLLKMAFVGVLVINGIMVGRLSHIATVRPFRELTPREKLPLLVSGALSGVGWVGAASIGLFFL